MTTCDGIDVDKHSPSAQPTGLLVFVMQGLPDCDGNCGFFFEFEAGGGEASNPFTKPDFAAR